MLGNFGAGGKQEHGRELRAEFLWILPALNFHLQCYRLRCFSFAQSRKILGLGVTGAFLNPANNGAGAPKANHIKASQPRFLHLASAATSEV